ncbi:hypothetical protein LEP1GSC051_2511 [Leptospira sp. P2653]|nr:hypothetical protein LEP1GSC051_2511 [Leptospira sp. P2653]
MLGGDRISIIRIVSWSTFVIFWTFSFWTICQQTIWLHNFQFFANLRLDYYLFFFGLLVSYTIIFPIARYADRRRIISNIILESEDEEHTKFLEFCNIINKRLSTTKKCLLEPISKMPKKDHSTSESNKPIEIKIVIFITDYESSKVLKPGKKTLDFPSSFVTPQSSTILCRLFSFLSMRCNDFRFILLQNVFV